MKSKDKSPALAKAQEAYFAPADAILERTSSTGDAKHDLRALLNRKKPQSTAKTSKTAS